MYIVILFLFLYFIANLVIGFSGKRARSDTASFLVAMRSVKPLMMFATLAATNFSAYTVFGLSGSGYRSGWGMYPVMAFGTGLMAISFMVIGIPLRRASVEGGHLSPSAYLRERYHSSVFGSVCSILLICITMPYVAMQAVAGGRLIESISGIPYPAASFMLLALTAAYVILGGMRAVVKTDALQLAILGLFCLAAFVIVLVSAGGFTVGSASMPWGSSPASPATGLPPETVLGFFLLWFLADPMFPHLAHRFQAAESDRALTLPMILYPLVTGILFFLTIGIGVLGAGIIPGLSVRESENIFQKLAVLISGPVIGPILALAGLAALMSTLDSQLLALASMITEDFFPRNRRSVRLNQGVVLLIALAGWLVSLYPPESVLAFLNATAFPAYAAIAPILIAGIYSRKTPLSGALAALVIAFCMVAAETILALKFGPFPAVAVNAAVSVIVLGGFRLKRPSAPFGNKPRNTIGEFIDIRGMLTLAILSVVTVFPYWRFFPGVNMAGVPLFVLITAGTCVLLSLEFWRLSKRYHA